MFDETIGKLADLGASKAAFLQRHPAGFLVSAAMAGIYVGFGILLIFSLGSLLDPSVRPLVMGASSGSRSSSSSSPGPSSTPASP